MTLVFICSTLYIECYNHILIFSISAKARNVKGENYATIKQRREICIWMVGNRSRRDNTFPTMALSEYNLTSDPEIIIFTGSKITGGFCVTNQRMLSSSKLKHIMDDLPELTGTHSINAGQFIPYKGRNYAWLPLSKEGTVQLPKQTLKFLNINAGDRLMSIRSSDNRFYNGGLKDPLLKKE